MLSAFDTLIGDGIAQPSNNVVATIGSVGPLSGSYYYSVTFVTALGETSPWPGTAIAVSPAAQMVNVSSIPIGPNGVIARRIYRTKAASPDPKDYYLLTTITDNTTTTFADNTADALLGLPANWGDTNRDFLTDSNDTVARYSLTSTSVGKLVFTVNTGYACVAVGNNSQQFLTTGRRNTSVGVYALQNATTAQRNTVVGTHSGNGITTSENNAFFGYASGGVTTSPKNFNVAVGAEAFFGNGTASGSGNIAIGYRALYNINTADQCIGLGFFAGQYANGSRQLFIDNVQRASLSAAQNQGLIFGQGQSIPQAQELRLNARVRLGWDPSLASVANLPLATSSLAGFRAWVNDASVPYSAATVGTVVVPGGNNAVPVFCIGTAWVVG